MTKYGSKSRRERRRDETIKIKQEIQPPQKNHRRWQIKKTKKVKCINININEELIDVFGNGNGDRLVRLHWLMYLFALNKSKKEETKVALITIETAMKYCRNLTL